MWLLQTQFPHLYSVRDSQHALFSLHPAGEQTLPLLCLEAPIWCQVVGLGPGWVTRGLGASDAASLCGPSVTYEGAEQGPGWAGTRALLGGSLPALATFPR